MNQAVASLSPAPGVTLSMRLDGRSALVVGASRGIGRGVALALAEAGADVALLGRTPEDLKRVAAEIVERGRSATVLPCDATDLPQTRAAVASLDRVDILVNSAGANIPEPFVDVSEEHFDRLFALNVRSVFFATQFAVRKMIDRGLGGSVINLTSQMGHVGAPRRTVYCASKHALEGLTKALSVELAPHGIRVNSVAPTFVETALTAPMFQDADFRADVLSKIPLGRVGQVADVTGAVVFLASPAAALITGTSLRVDGGWTAQ